MDNARARRVMIENQLRPEGVTDVAVLAAMGSVPREDHVPDTARAFAYFDRTIDLDDGRTLMPPAALGRLLSEAAPRPGERALVVGAGSGYAAAVLEAIGLSVQSIDGPDGGEGEAVDLILIDGAVAAVPQSLVDRLAANGRLVTAIHRGGVSRLSIGRAVGGRLGLRSIVDSGVSPLPRFAAPRAFEF